MVLRSAANVRSKRKQTRDKQIQRVAVPRADTNQQASLQDPAPGREAEPLVD